MLQSPPSQAAEAAQQAAQDAQQAAQQAAQAARAQAAEAARAARGADVAPVVATIPLPPAAFTGGAEDAQVLAGLRARIDLLREQLERVGERRGELANQLSNTSHAEGAIREGFEARLRVLDDQMVQLEKDIVVTERQLAAAPPQLLATTEEPHPIAPSGPDEGEVVGIGMAGFVLGLIVMMVGRRIRAWRRRGERGAAAATAAAPAADPRIERLAHAVDAIAVEVERIGEGQRFVTQLLAESRGRAPELAAADAAATQSVPGVR